MHWVSNLFNLFSIIWAFMIIASGVFHWKLPRSEKTWLLSIVVSAFYGPCLLVLLLIVGLTQTLGSLWILSSISAGVAFLLLALVIWDKWQAFKDALPDATFKKFGVIFKLPWPLIKPDLFYEAKARDEARIPIEIFKASKTKSPLVIFFFGGGFLNNDQSQNRIFLDQIRRLGFHVASVGYRQLPRFPWPHPLLDTEDAVGDLMTEAWPDMEFESFHLMGRSAGGFMALQTSLLSFAKPIQTCTAIYPLTDLKIWSEEPISNQVLNSKERVRLLVQGNWDLAISTSLLNRPFEKPIRYFLISGDSDPVVDVQQTQLLQKHLQNLGNDCTTIILRSDTHGFDFNPYSWATQALFHSFKQLR